MQALALLDNLILKLETNLGLPHRAANPNAAPLAAAPAKPVEETKEPKKQE
jgi:hypothetical protein